MTICRISVIIPVLHEPAEVLADLRGYVERNGSPETEWIVVGTPDEATHVAPLLQAAAPVSLVISRPGRAAQMNAGAREAGGDILLFLHADTRLAGDWRQQLQSCGSDWGAFLPGLSGEGALLRQAERWGAWRSRSLGLPYGDQAIFVRAQHFWDAGGFDETLPFMEDVDLARRLGRARGKPAILPSAALASSRRYARHGALRTSVKNLVALVLFLMAVPPGQIKQLYDRL